MKPDIFLKTRRPSGRALPIAANRPVLERNLYVPVPALYRSRPSVALWLTTNKLLSKINIFVLLLFFKVSISNGLSVRV